MKIKRIVFIKIHLWISGVIMMLLCLYSLTGSLHLFVDIEKDTTTQVSEEFEISIQSKKELETYFRSQLKEIAPKYNFDYMKGSNDRMMTRPTSRDYYELNYNEQNQTAILFLKSPNIAKRLMEFHKGHGPKLSRPVLGLVGILIFFSALSGLWLGLSLKAYRKTTIITVLSGIILFSVLISL